MVSLTPQISMMAMIAPTGVRSGIARYAPISPSRSLTLMDWVFISSSNPSLPHPEEPSRSEGVSKDRPHAQAAPHRPPPISGLPEIGTTDAQVDVSLRDAPHHEAG